MPGSDGYLYGTTNQGGTAAGGTMFRLTTAGVLTTLANFDDSDGTSAFGPTSALMEGSDGNFYGTTKIGGTGPDTDGVGTFYQVTPGGLLITLHSLNGTTDGSYTTPALTRGTDGNFYGYCLYGTLFRVTPAGAVTTIHTFSRTANEGFTPSSLILGSDHALYGTTTDGGIQGDSSIFQFTTAGAVSVVASFGTSVSPGGSPVLGFQDGSGNFYGTTFSATGSGGTVFQVTAAGALTTLHAFTQGGGRSVAPLLVGQDGNFYGTTVLGGTTSDGTVFSLTPAGVLTTLHSFNADLDGSRPASGLVQTADGYFYGTTSQGYVQGGHYVPAADGFLPNDADGRGDGSLYKGYRYSDGTLRPEAWEPEPGTGYQLIGAFCHFAYTNNPVKGNAVPADDAITTFYAVEAGSGANGFGAVVSMTSEGIFTTLHDFAGAPGDRDGAAAGLIGGSDGNLYGTTQYGGANNQGTVFRITPAGAETVLYSFGTATGDGACPAAEVVQGSDGNFYGTTQYATFDTTDGSSTGSGTIFRLTPGGTLTTIHIFAADGSEGQQSRAALLQTSDGNFHGTTSIGGTGYEGTLFSITPGEHLQASTASVLALARAGQSQNQTQLHQRERACRPAGQLGQHGEQDGQTGDRAEQRVHGGRHRRTQGQDQALSDPG